MRIEELHLKNFRCFKELDIQFPKSNLAVFIGLNGAGKSAILDAISALLDGKGTPNNHMYYSDGDVNISSGQLCNRIKIKYRNDFYEWSHLKNLFERCKAENCSFDYDYYYDEHIGDMRACSEHIVHLHYNSVREKLYPFEPFLEKNEQNNFGVFKRWFIEESNKENRVIIEKKDFSITNPLLDVIRYSIEKFCSNISNMKVFNLRIKDVNKNTELIINWNGEDLTISQLSDGQKILILLVSDIALALLDGIGVYKTKISKSEVGDVLKEDGIVLIDEIELHLHPQWQREVLHALQKTFPNIQFIVTTHSPQVLSRVHKDDIFILKDNQLYQPSSNPIGRDSSDILDEIMDITKRPDDIQKLSDDYFLLLAKNELEEAAKIRTELDKLVEDKKLDKDDPIFYRANGILARKQLLKK